MKLSILILLLFAFTHVSTFAQVSLSGKLTDAQNNEALVGASVLVKGTSNGTTTNTQGEFNLRYSGNFPLTLIFSYIGYETKEFVLSANQPIQLQLTPTEVSLNELNVTARRRSEEVQDIPIPIAVISAKELDNSSSFNVNRVKELIPSVQLYSSNPRNTTLNIRGIGSTFGLTNDGIDPGVGFYVDGVYLGRSAATTLFYRCSAN